MAFLLVPKSGESLMINAWNWRPTIELLRDAKQLDDDLYERMVTLGREANVDADTARRFADFIDLRLQAMNRTSASGQISPLQTCLRSK